MINLISKNDSPLFGESIETFGYLQRILGIRGLKLILLRLVFFEVVHLSFLVLFCFLFFSLHSVSNLLHLIDAIVFNVFVKVILLIVIVTLHVVRYARFAMRDRFVCRVHLLVSFHSRGRPHIWSHIHSIYPRIFICAQYLIVPLCLICVRKRHRIPLVVGNSSSHLLFHNLRSQMLLFD